MKTLRLICIGIMLLNFTGTQAKTYYFDDITTHGDGSLSDPFNDFSQLQITLIEGDTLFVMPGTYYITESIRFRNSGTETNPIVIMAYDPTDRPVFNNANLNQQIFRIQAHHQVYDGFILNGQYCAAQIISISSPDPEVGPSENVTIKNCTIRRTLRDGIILTYTNNTLIDNCEICYCLRDDFVSQTDAHGVVGRHVTNLIVQNCNIHHTSGDCFQVGSDYSPPLWNNVTIKNCKFWTSHLAQDEAGFLAGEKPGENAIDTKTDPLQDKDEYRPKINIENVEAFGFLNDPPDQVYISGRSAFNIKSNVEATIKNCILYDNAYAYRFRGPQSNSGYNWGGAHVTMINCIAYDNWKAVWMEYDVERVHIYNCTFDKKDSTYCVFNATSSENICNPAEYFRIDSYVEEGFEAQNNVFVGEIPTIAADVSNIATQPDDFRDYNLHEYYPAEGGIMIDKGVDLALVPEDISGYVRTNGSYDAGAYEYRGPLEENPDPFTHIETDIDNHLIMAYPNPTSGIINIKMDRSMIASVNNLAVYNLVGSKVISLNAHRATEVDDGFFINVSNLFAGVYFINLTFKNEKPVVIKFIKYNE